jgi:hypothetical protein
VDGRLRPHSSHKNQIKAKPTHHHGLSLSCARSRQLASIIVSPTS